MSGDGSPLTKVCRLIFGIGNRATRPSRYLPGFIYLALSEVKCNVYSNLYTIADKDVLGYVA